MEILPLHRALHRATLHQAEAAAWARRRLALLGRAEQAKLVTVGDGLCERVAVAGGRYQQTATDVAASEPALTLGIRQTEAPSPLLASNEHLVQLPKERSPDFEFSPFPFSELPPMNSENSLSPVSSWLRFLAGSLGQSGFSSLTYYFLKIAINHSGF
jgi:hypothetical protein